MGTIDANGDNIGHQALADIQQMERCSIHSVGNKSARQPLGFHDKCATSELWRDKQMRQGTLVHLLLLPLQLFQLLALLADLLIQLGLGMEVRDLLLGDGHVL